MHHLMHTFEVPKTLGIQGIIEEEIEGMHCMHLFSDLLFFYAFSLKGDAYHAYRRMPSAGIGGTKPKTRGRTVCIG